MRFFSHTSIFILAILSITACTKDPAVTSNSSGQTNSIAALSYGDSIFYLRNEAYLIKPLVPRSGSYTAFPDNLLIDNATGNITVTITGKAEESQTGMRYKIMFQDAATSQKDSTYIVLAGINYLDRIYYLSQNDTIISPVYNSDLSRSVPSGSYGIQADNELAIDPATGKINIKECVRRGLFDRPAENGEWEELTVQYKSNDKSNSATNRIDIALYYYNTINEVPRNISTVMRAHQSLMLGIAQPEIPQTPGPIENDLPDNLSIGKPRPPCIIIIAN